MRPGHRPRRPAVSSSRCCLGSRPAQLVGSLAARHKVALPRISVDDMTQVPCLLELDDVLAGVGARDELPAAAAPGP
jgi:hypothetical protein